MKTVNDPLPPLNNSPSSSSKKVSDNLQIALIRSDMIKVQKNIQQLLSSYETILNAIPPNLSSKMVDLHSTIESFNVQIRNEDSAKFDVTLNNMKTEVANFRKQLHDYQGCRAEIQQPSDTFTPKVNTLDLQLKNSTDQFISQLQAKVDEKLEPLEAKIRQTRQANSCKLTYNFAIQDSKENNNNGNTTNENNEESESEKFKQQLQRRQDGERLLTRVRKHISRIRLAEEDFVDAVNKSTFQTETNQRLAVLMKYTEENSKSIADITELLTQIKGPVETPKKENESSETILEKISQEEFTQFFRNNQEKAKKMQIRIQELESEVNLWTKELDKSENEVEKQMQSFEDSANSINQLVDILSENLNNLQKQAKSNEERNQKIQEIEEKIKGKQIQEDDLEEVTKAQKEYRLKAAQIQKEWETQFASIKKRISQFQS